MIITEKIRAYAKTGWSAILKLLAGINLLTVESSSGTIRKYSLTHDNLKRAFKVYLPLNHPELALKPLVMVLHGRGGNGESMILLTRNGFNRLADRDGFIVVYPDGIEMNWNDGRTYQESDDRAHRENIDDVGFIASLIDLMVRNHGADRKKVYITGISNGAIMAYRLACELSGKISAIAPVDGNMPYALVPCCMPQKPVSVLAINNTDDPLVPYEGGDIQTGLTRTSLGKVLSVKESVEYWIKANNCNSGPVEEELPDMNPEDGIRVTKKAYINEANGAGVILYTIHGGGHTWPGGLQYMPAGIIGKTCRDFDANEVIWSFFREHSTRLQETMYGE